MNLITIYNLLWDSTTFLLSSIGIFPIMRVLYDFKHIINNSTQGVTSIPLSFLASYGLRVDENFIRLIVPHLSNILANRSFILSLLNMLISSTHY